MINNNFSLSIGVLIYNSSDNIDHIERISKCIVSLIEAAKFYNGKIKILLLLNYSFDYYGRCGVGHLTENTVLNLYKKYINEYDNIYISGIRYENSMNVAGYSFIQSWGLLQDSEYIVVSADDYVYPKKWFVRLNMIYRNAENHNKFIIPTTTFLAQGNLQAPVRIKKNWTINYSTNKEILGIKSGLTISDVNQISKYCQFIPCRNYREPPMFEVSIIPRNIIKEVGTVDKSYYSIFYNIEYFENILRKGYKGLISNKLFVFHYGKGGTQTVFNMGDEKYVNSPVEKNLLRDITLYNEKNQKNITPWWGSKPTRIKTRGFFFNLFRQFYLYMKEIYA